MKVNCFSNIASLTILLFFIFGVNVNTNAQTLVWEESFSDSVVNTNTWTYDFGDGCERALCGWGNSELQYYTSRLENVRTENGKLIIEAKRENFASSAFTSGRIKSEGRLHFKYGTVEARIKIPSIQNGLWPAFWTLGTVGGSWPSIGEMDIMEIGAANALQAGLGNRRVSSAAHWSNANGAHEYNTSFIDAQVDLSSDYHLYKMVWNSQFIKMYLDGVEYYSYNISAGAAANISEFHQPHFLLLNLAVGGAYPGIYSAAGITAPLPGKMYVDYIKLYQNPGDELYFGNNNAASGNFGVFTENTVVTDSLRFGTNATLYYWNNLVNITNPSPVPQEGNNVWAVRANANNWFGMGVDNNYVNLNNFATGSLKFHFKTTYSGQFKIGIKTGHGESWVNFPANTQPYGLVRDGNWHQITIPMSTFNNTSMGMNVDLLSVKGAFMFAGDPATANAEFYFDNIYYSGGILANAPPTIALTTPANDSIYLSPTSITLQATATDANGTVTKVDFYSGNNLLATDSIAPYSFMWNNPSMGVHIITAKATDNLGASTTSLPVNVFVSTASNTAPSASISFPLNGATILTPASINIIANVIDTTSTIYKVEFFNGSALLGTDSIAPYTYLWVGAGVGNYTLTIKATDVGGLSTISSPVNITVANPIKPTVSITSPNNGASFVPPANVLIQANAADANGTVLSVDFYNGNTLLGTDSTSPYTYNWTSLAQGNYTITAKATDNDSNFTISTPVSFRVSPAACAGVAVNGEYSYEVYTAGGTVFFRFRPLGAVVGSSSAIIYLREGSSGGVYPGYNMTAAAGDFTFSKAIANNVPTSFYFSYNLPSGGENNSSTNPHSYLVGTVCVAGAPSVNITSPTSADSYTAPANFSITANASDVDGNVVKVSFYNGATLLGEDFTAPYLYNYSNAPAATYQLTAVATDNSGLTTTSTPITVIVANPSTDGYCGTAFNGDYKYKAETIGAQVRITFHPLAPIQGSSYALVYMREGLSGGYAGYSMSAIGTDFIYSKSIANATPISIYFTYNIPGGGERNSSANPHSYTVGTNCTGTTGSAPTVNITTPTNNAIFTEPASISISANAADADGTVTKVEFFNGNTLLATDFDSPYSYVWQNVPAGNYSIAAKVTDNNSLTTFSNFVNVGVNINHSIGFCGTVANGDYSYRTETNNGIVTFIFHPLTPILGCSYAFIYVREGASGGYPGYAMTAVGSDFRFTKTINNGVPLSIYFTYNVPAGGERNSSATPHSYTTGTVCAGLTLPVIFTNFTANYIANRQILLEWATSSELNNQYFIIEKSIDGNSFKEIAKVSAANNAVNGSSYNFTDANAFLGSNYYRLKQVDKDGKYAYYKIVIAKVPLKGQNIMVYPNPLNSKFFTLKLENIDTKVLQVQLYTLEGKLFFEQKKTVQGDILPIELPFKPKAGFYLLKVNKLAPVKIIVQ